MEGSERRQCCYTGRDASRAQRIGLVAWVVMVVVVFAVLTLTSLPGFEAALSRDYPLMFATVYIFTLLGLLLNLLGDLMYVIIDPRIDFEARAA